MKNIKRTGAKKAAKARKVVMGIGTGLAAAGAVAAAGYYFYGSKGAKKHRKIVMKWANDMKKEVVKEAKHLEKINPKAFSTIVDRVAETYQDVRSADVDEVKRAAKELKANWDKIQKETKHTIRKHVSRAKKTIGKRAK
ncbi:MAG: hypothetical protein NUV60_00710 [Patescibacteria group bacterium]|nr:hypothetical protein [Patescibacteria group bacterium]